MLWRVAVLSVATGLAPALCALWFMYTRVPMVRSAGRGYVLALLAGRLRKQVFWRAQGQGLVGGGWGASPGYTPLTEYVFGFKGTRSNTPTSVRLRSEKQSGKSKLVQMEVSGISVLKWSPTSVPDRAD